MLKIKIISAIGYVKHRNIRIFLDDIAGIYFLI